MTDSASEDLAAPESWEAADLDAAVSRLLISTSSKRDVATQEDVTEPSTSAKAPASAPVPAPSSAPKVSDDVINQVDQFLLEAIQNPRERVSVLRMEQDVEKFVRDPTQQQMEFQELPTSYLRLAAHRLAQHYFLHSMVFMDNTSLDGSGSRIILNKTSKCRLPSIRLADIPVNLPSGDSSLNKVAIKQRNKKKPSVDSASSSNSVKSNNSRSVEERKEEYNRARARIFNSDNSNVGHGGKPEREHRMHDGSRVCPPRTSRVEEKHGSGPSGASNANSTWGWVDSSASSSKAPRNRTEEPFRHKPNNRVAIFRDRDTERNDPDYDRSYDRYMQHFDPGFGFNSGPYSVQPMFTPALTYNTEFPQLGSTQRPQIYVDHQPRPLPQHPPVPWTAPTPSGIPYAQLHTMVTPFNPNPVGPRSTSALYMHSYPFPCQGSGMPFIPPHEQVHQPFAQSQQSQTDACFGLARPR